MTATVTLFASLTSPTGPQLDGNFQVNALAAPVNCSVSGTNNLTLTQNSNNFTIAAYNAGMQLCGVAGASNTGAMTARLGSLAFLNVYKDSATGPAALSGNELIIGNRFTLVYDAALNTGAGGFHLVASTADAGLPMSGGTLTGALVGPSSTFSIGSLASLMIGASAATLTRLLSVSTTVTFTVVPANTTQNQTVALPGAQPGDSVAIGPPSTALAGVGYTAYVSAAGTVTLRAINPTAASLTPTGGLYRLTAMGFG